MEDVVIGYDYRYMETMLMESLPVREIVSVQLLIVSELEMLCKVNRSR